MNQIDTVIVGAGPYGLSIAAHLKEAKLPFRIFGSPVESWRTFMPKGMLLKSERFASNLWDSKRKYTFERYCAEKGIRYRPFGNPLSLEHFLEYADWFRDRAVGEVTDIKVTEVKKTPEGFSVKLADGKKIQCRQVILATGHMAFQSVPAEFSALPAPLCLHSAQLNDLEMFRGRDVTVVGAGQSAIETAALLHEIGARTRLLVRKNQVAWNDPSSDAPRSFITRMTKPEAGLGAGWKIVAISELPRIFRYLFSAEKRHRFVEKSWGPSGAAWLRPRVEGKVDITLGSTVRSASMVGGKVRLKIQGPSGESELMTDHVIAATGFKVDLDLVNYLDHDLKKSIAREGKAPALDHRFETSIRGLFIVGVASAPTFGPVMRFMFGAKHVGPTLSRLLKSR